MKNGLLNCWCFTREAEAFSLYPGGLFVNIRFLEYITFQNEAHIRKIVTIIIIIIIMIIIIIITIIIIIIIIIVIITITVIIMMLIIVIIII